MDTPLENPEGYKNANLTNYVNNLQDKLLMIHGCDDDVVLWHHSLLYCKSAVDAGNTYLDYFVYPAHKHNVMGKDRVHLIEKILTYILKTTTKPILRIQRYGTSNFRKSIQTNVYC